MVTKLFEKLESKFLFILSIKRKEKEREQR